MNNLHLTCCYLVCPIADILMTWCAPIADILVTSCRGLVKLTVSTKSMFGGPGGASAPAPARAGMVKRFLLPCYRGRGAEPFLPCMREPEKPASRRRLRLRTQSSVHVVREAPPNVP